MVTAHSAEDLTVTEKYRKLCSELTGVDDEEKFSFSLVPKSECCSNALNCVECLSNLSRFTLQRQRFAGNRLETKNQLDERMTMTGIECRSIHWSCSWREPVSSGGVQQREDCIQSSDMCCWMQVDLGLDALFGKFECAYGSDWYHLCHLRF